MGAADVPLAKLSRPRVGNMLARERLFASLDRLRERPVVWIAAEPGAGKTTLMAGYLESRKLGGIWYHLDAGDADPASFFYHLGIAAQGLKRGRGEAPLPLLTPDQGADLAGFARRYFRALYARLGRNGALVLDNLHEVADSASLHALIATGFAEAPPGVVSLVGSRREPPTAYTPLVACDRVGFMVPEDMRLTLEESTRIIHDRAELDAESVRRLHDQAGGWAAGLTLLVERSRRGGPVADEVAGTLQPVFAFFAEQLLATDFAQDTEALLALSYLPEVSPAMAQALTGNARAGALLERLHRRHLFTQRRVVRGHASYELHALLRGHLQARAERAWPVERQRETMARAAGLLEREARPEDAIVLLRRLEDWAGVARLVLGEAQALMAQGRRQTLREWILAVPESLRQGQPRLLYWLATAVAQDDVREARALYQAAHASFTAAGDGLGRLLATVGIVSAHYLEMADLREMDPWIRELNAVIDARTPFPTPGIELHVHGALLFGLCFRMPDPVRIAVSARRMFLLLEDPSIAAHDKIAAAGLLLFHCYHHAEIEDGERLARLMAPLVPRANPGVQALWHVHMGFFANTKNDYAAAERAYETAARLCSDNGLSIPLVDVYVDLGLAMASVILQRDVARAEACRQRAERHWRTFRRIDMATHSMLRCLIASHRGDFAQAMELAEKHRSMAHEGGIQWQEHNAILNRACMEYESGLADRGRASTLMARALVAGTVYDRFSYQGDLIDAYGQLIAGNLEAARPFLVRGLAAGRVDTAKFFLRFFPRLLPRVFAAALREGIEPDLVRRDIQALRIAPPDPHMEEWPWPLAVQTLGRFEIRRPEGPIAFSRKAPKKTLALLKAIVALGGSNVREQALLDALWPDEEGDAAAKSLGAQVLRLRTLLGDGEAVVQQGGTLSLDRARVGVDAWAFEQGGRLDLYRGAFLAEDEAEPWAVPMRERLRARFIHEAAGRGEGLERDGRHADAIEWYLRGLEADIIVEPFYQGLMRCYLRLDRRAEAIATYRRLKQILSVTLGLPPSAASDRLYRQASKAESVGEK